MKVVSSVFVLLLSLSALAGQDQEIVSKGESPAASSKPVSWKNFIQEDYLDQLPSQMLTVAQETGFSELRQDEIQEAKNNGEMYFFEGMEKVAADGMCHIKKVTLPKANEIKQGDLSASVIVTKSNEGKIVIVDNCFAEPEYKLVPAKPFEQLKKENQKGILVKCSEAIEGAGRFVAVTSDNLVEAAENVNGFLKNEETNNLLNAAGLEEYAQAIQQQADAIKDNAQVTQSVAKKASGEANKVKNGTMAEKAATIIKAGIGIYNFAKDLYKAYHADDSNQEQK